MRLSSVQIFQQGISAILDQQAKVQHTQQQLATGKRVLTPSDDPAAAVQILDITENLAQIDQYNRNGDLAEGQLALEESVLGDIGNVLQRIRELVVQANNASQSPETRSSAATEVAARLDELLALANTRDAGDEFIFGGFQSSTEPFVRQGTTYSYQGDDGQRMLQLSANSTVAVRDSGKDVFLSIPTGNGVFTVQADPANAGNAVAGTRSTTGAVAEPYTLAFSQASATDPVTYQVLDSSATVVSSGNYTAGATIAIAGASIQFDGVPVDGDSFEISPSGKQDLFTSVQTLVDSLKSAGSAPAEVAALNNQLGESLQSIDNAMTHVMQVRTDVGVRMNQVENQLNLNDSFSVQLQESLSEIQDLDLAEAISRLNLQMVALQAAQQTYVKVQGLSLFNYL